MCVFERRRGKKTYTEMCFCFDLKCARVGLDKPLHLVRKKNSSRPVLTVSRTHQCVVCKWLEHKKKKTRNWRGNVLSNKTVAIKKKTWTNV